MQILEISREQHQRAQARRADGVALGDGLGGVADRVERIGGDAHFLRQVRHFGDAAGVICHRAEGVERDDDAGHRKHAGDGDGDAKQASQQLQAMMPATMVSAGSAVDSIDTARPWITLVPWPETEALAMLFTGRKPVPV